MTSDSKSDQSVVPTKDLAWLLDVTPRFVSELGARGVLVKAGRGRWPVVENVRRYIQFVRESQSGGNDELASAKLQLVKAQHKRIEQTLSEKQANERDDAWQFGLLDGLGAYLTTTLPSLGSSCYAKLVMRDHKQATQLANIVQQQAAGLAYTIKQDLRNAAELARTTRQRLDSLEILQRFISLSRDNGGNVQ